MASSHRLASQKNREPRLAVRAVKGTLFSTGGEEEEGQEEEEEEGRERKRHVTPETHLPCVGGGGGGGLGNRNKWTTSMCPLMRLK